MESENMSVHYFIITLVTDKFNEQLFFAFCDSRGVGLLSASLLYVGAAVGSVEHVQARTSS
jgi:hypothetical protein